MVIIVVQYWVTGNHQHHGGGDGHGGGRVGIYVDDNGHRHVGVVVVDIHWWRWWSTSSLL